MAEEKLDGPVGLELTLESPDTVLECDVTTRLKSFMANGGQPGEAIQLLTKSYRGTGEMANFAMDLLCSLGEEKAAVHKLVADHLRSLLVSKFDTKIADSLLQREAMPEWLESLLADPSNHSCLATLAERHPNSLLLKYATLKVHEYDAKLTSSSFQTFTGALTAKLIELLRCPANSLALIGELQVFACQSAFEYLFTQRLLYTLRNSGQAARRGEVARGICKRLSQDLSAYAQKQHGPSVVSLDILAQDLGRFPLVQENQALSDADITKLHMLCSSANTLPVEFLRNEKVIRRLLGAMYSPGQVQQPANLAKMIHLLAVASLLPAGAVPSLSAGTGRVQAALAAVQALFVQRAYSMAPLQFKDTLSKHLDIPIVCAAFMAWVSKLLRENHFDETLNHLCADLFCFFLSKIASRFPLLHQQVFDVVVKLFAVDWLPPLVTSELKTKALRMLVHLVHCGCLKPVFGLMAAEVASMDHALIRRFLVTLVSSVSPPFSEEFGNSLLDLLLQSSVLNSVAHSLSAEDRQHLNQTVQHLLTHKHLLPPQAATLHKYLSAG